MPETPDHPARPGLLLPAFRWVLNHRAIVVLVCALITLLALASASRLVIGSSIGKLFLDEVPEYQVYLDRMGEFGSDELFVVAYEEPELLSPEALQKLEQVVAHTREQPEVGRVLSLLDAVEISSSDGVLSVSSYADKAREDKPDDLLASLLADERYRGRLLSRDGRVGAIVVELVVDPYRPAEKGPQVVGRVVDALLAAGYEREQLHRGGVTATIAEVMAESYRSLTLFFPLSALALLGVVLLLFRRLAPALMTLGVGMLSVIWTLGFAAVLDRNCSIFTSLMPVVVLTVAFSDIVHLWNAYVLELRAGLSKRAAILATSKEVGSACLLTSVTTGIGFLSLSAVPTPVARQLGIVLGFGVAVALLLAVTLVPVAMSWMAEPPLDSTEKIHRRLDRWIAWAADLSTRRAGWVLAIFALLLIPLGIGAAKFEMKADFAERFDESSRFAEEQRFLAANFSGLNTIDLFIQTPEARGLLDTEVFARIGEVQDAILALPEVDEVISPVDLVRELHGAVQGPDQAGQLPTSPGAVAQYLLLLEMAEGGEAQGEALQSHLDFERRVMRMAVWLPEQDFRETGRVGVEIQKQAEALLAGVAQVEVTGMGFLLGWSFNALVKGQQTALLLSLLAVTLLMTLGLRSVSIGLLSMIPNLLPLLALIAYAGYRWDQVDTDICLIAIMAIGIGVDD
ncbi:MAG: MMPL family transporter, partial [Myxococcota bacterium]|nr:MMPL family transporter [Myxococcota bacterium]